MIEKAIEHINAQVKECNNSMAGIIGKYLKSVVISDMTAVEILKEGRTIADFCVKIDTLARKIRDGEVKSASEVFKTIVSEDFDGAAGYMTREFSNELGEILSENSAGNLFGISSEVIIPLLHAYYNIPLSGIAASNNTQAHSNPHGFKRVSLD